MEHIKLINTQQAKFTYAYQNTKETLINYIILIIIYIYIYIYIYYKGVCWSFDVFFCTVMNIQVP